MACRNRVSIAFIQRIVLGIALAGLGGCASSMAPIQSERASSAAAVPAQSGRHPTSWRLASPPAPTPPATGVATISVPSIVVEPLVEHQLGPSALALDASGVQIIAADRPTPLNSDRPRNPAPDLIAPKFSDRALQIPVSGEPPEPLAPPALIATSTFGSVDFDTNAVETLGYSIPPDPDAAAGPNHVVNVVNTVIRFHKKDGTITFTDSLKDFFAAESPATNTFDPKVVFDPFEGRFVVVTLEVLDDGEGGEPEVSKILLAVSDDSDPNGDWCSTTIPGNTMFLDENSDPPAVVDHWADYPGFSVDEEAIYITNNMFEFEATKNESPDPADSPGIRLWIVDKAVGSGALYDCAGASISVAASVSKFDPYAGGGIVVTTQPAQIHGRAPDGVGTYLVSYNGLTLDFATPDSSEFVQVVRIDDPLGSPLFTQEFVAVSNIEDATAVFVDAPQSGLTDLIETNDRRALDAEWIDNRLWMTATIIPEAPADSVDGGETTAHWWELDTSTPGLTTLVGQGNISGDDLTGDMFTYFPSVAVNGRNQAAFGYSGSASTIFAGSYYTGRNPGDAAGTTQGSAMLKAGEAPYCRTFTSDDRNRWGDYTGTETDPVDGCFWFYNQHAWTTGSPTPDSTCSGTGDEVGRWSTYYGKMCPVDACPADMFLADIELSGSQARIASSRISTGADVVVKSGADVTFQAEDIIVFFSGFSVENSATFTAELKDDACL